MKCVHIGVHVKSSYSYVQNTPQPHRQSMKLRIMISSIKQRWCSSDMCEFVQGQRAILIVIQVGSFDEVIRL